VILNYGTELVGINCHEKLGSTSIKILEEHFDMNRYEEDESREYYKNKKYVIVVRDIMERWKSGYLQDMMSAFIDDLDGWKTHNVASSNSLFWDILSTKELESFNPNSEPWKGNPNVLLHGLDTITKIHRIDKDTSWMYLTGHSKFFTWTQGQQTLSELMGLDNVYFVELKDLSSIEFKKWLCSQDVQFERVSHIVHANKKSNFIEKNIDLFWKEFGEGKIQKYYRMSDIEKLLCPMIKYDKIWKQDIILRPYHELCAMTQYTLDFIRKHHERYIKC
tara:strand:- start:438 stop:1268 length:831 start_codon:yes stop_codon:yes gene_type:complete